MSLIRVECASCRTPLQVRPELAGGQGRCPRCGATVSIPHATTPSEQSPQSPAESFLGGSSSKSSIIVKQVSIDQVIGPPVAAPSAAGTSSAAASSVARAAAKAAPPSSVKLPSTAAPPLTLALATAADMMAEIGRRKKSAVMIVFETPPNRTYELSQQPESNVRCYRTPDMNDEQLLQVLHETARMPQGTVNAKGGLELAATGGPQPFELKGDRLGMTLDEFKAKYARRLGPIVMPYCSDCSPGQAIEALWTEPWHSAAGIVHGRVDLPSESNPPTLAGEKTENWLYHFVDGRLFRMTVQFDTEAFHHIHAAMLPKMGAPTHELKEPVEYQWDNGVCGMRLARGTMRPRKPSTIILFHHALQKTAEGRLPRRSADV